MPPSFMRSSSLLIVCMALMACGSSSVPNDTRARPEPTEQLEEAERSPEERLRGVLLESPSGQSEREISFRTQEQSFGSTLTGVLEPQDLYTPVATLIVGSDGLTYGQHGERDVADLIRRSGWLISAPTITVMERVISDAYFNGLLSIRAGSRQIELTDGVLEFSARSVDPFTSPPHLDISARVGATGNLRLERTPVVPTLASPL